MGQLEHGEKCRDWFVSSVRSAGVSYAFLAKITQGAGAIDEGQRRSFVTHHRILSIALVKAIVVVPGLAAAQYDGGRKLQLRAYR